MQTDLSHIAENIKAVQQNIAEACQRANRSTEEVKLVAVSKTRPVAELRAAVTAGITDLGENRVEEALSKQTELADLMVNWHMIGHVQSRKAKDVINKFAYIHSLDSLKLAHRYDNFWDTSGVFTRILLEINVSGENSKEGLSANNWQTSATQRATLWEFIETLQTLPNIHIDGLMTMAPYVTDEKALRPVFVKLRELRNALAERFPDYAWTELSMGMTNDYPLAIEEGATIVRIGRAIFGERN